jgi:hypothetical protein
MRLLLALDFMEEAALPMTASIKSTAGHTDGRCPMLGALLWIRYLMENLVEMSAGKCPLVEAVLVEIPPE